MQEFFKFIFGIKLYMFRTFPLSIIRIFHCTHSKTSMTYTIAVCTVKNREITVTTPHDGRNYLPKHIVVNVMNKLI